MCPISFNISGMKLNEEHFSSRTVVLHFLDKPYQEIDFKSHLNSALLCKYGKMLSDLHISRVILFHFTFCAHFWYKIENCQLQKSLKYFNILRPLKNNVRFEYVHGKMSDFVSFPLFGFILVIKLRNSNFVKGY